MGMGGGGSSNTVTQSQQIPLWEQENVQQNQAFAGDIAARPYTPYAGDLTAGFSPFQTQGQNMAVGAANSYQPGLAAGQATTAAALDPTAVNNNLAAGNSQIGASNQATTGAMNATGLNQYSGAAAHADQGGMNGAGLNGYSGLSASGIGSALGASGNNPNVIASYMNPYISQALAPQIQQLQSQLAQQQKGINDQATQAGAFGDARQGVAQSTANLNSNLALNQLIGSGYNNAYNTALGAAQQQQNFGLQGAQQLQGLAGLQGQEQGLQLQGGNQLAGLAGLQGQEQGLQMQGAQNLLAGAGMYNNLAQTAGQEQQTQLAGGNQQAQLGALAQQLGLTGAGAVYNAGQQQQTQQQQTLNTAYQQYLNQQNWLPQMLNIRESAVSNSPYSIQTATTLPNANNAAQGFGTVAGLAGLLGGAASGGAASGSPFGGAALATGSK